MSSRFLDWILFVLMCFLSTGHVKAVKQMCIYVVYEKKKRPTAMVFFFKLTEEEKM